MECYQILILVLYSFQDCLSRQTAEGVCIRRCKKDILNTKSEWNQPSLWWVRSELNKELKYSNTEPILVIYVCFLSSSESIYFSFTYRNSKLMSHLIMNMLSSDQAKQAKHCLQQYNETKYSYFLFHSQCKCY